ncbi:hypothetical protein [Phytohabitans kaempferiae]|uniref:ABC transporter permease n=1 Tax=Phytohabitans kaempferiae TaxID=1620943 RepID=A0ABV6M892_9ACTN
MKAPQESAPLRTTFPRGPRRNTALIVARAQFRAGLPMVAYYWAIMFAVYALIMTVVLTVADTEVSIWATSGGSAPKYFLLAVGVMLTTVYLPMYIGNGVTRRDFALGASICIVAVAVVYAVTMTLGFAIEYAIYSAGDLFGGLEDPYPVRSLGDGMITLVEELLVGTVYLCCGWLLGTFFYRFGALVGIALIPVSVVPAVVTETMFDSLWLGLGINEGLGLEPPALPVGVLVAVASIAVAWLVNFALVRAVSIKKVSG